MSRDENKLGTRVVVIKQDAPDVLSNVHPDKDPFLNLAAGGSQSLVPTPDGVGFTSLAELEHLNNALGSCVDAMEVNIDGTGHAIETRTGDAPTDLEGSLIERAEEFFAEPWPGESMITLRRKIRRDIELTGNGFMEVVRNLVGDIVFLRRAPAGNMRMVKLDKEVLVSRTVRRNGGDITIKIPLRERRFAQLINGRLIYFKEFKASRDLDKNTGRWARKGENISLAQRGSEIIHFVAKPHAVSPYGVPRWWAQMPSVVGSRKAEEHNLAFFDRGGIPPVMILVQGGSLAEEASENLKKLLEGSDPKQMAAVLEVFSTGGTLDKDSPVRVTVERFGSERQNDAMFSNYDAESEERVRRAFRLPPMFVGKAQDYNFATARTSYMVAEAQVFRPERVEFDEVINTKLMPEIVGPGLVFRSLPLNIKNIDDQMSALKLVASVGDVSRDSLVTNVNEVADLNLSLPEGEDGSLPVGQSAQPPQNAAQASKDETGTQDIEKGDVDGVIVLAQDTARQVSLGPDRDPTRWGMLMKSVASLSPRERKVFDSTLAVEMFVDPALDPDGASQLAGCTLAILDANRWSPGHA